VEAHLFGDLIPALEARRILLDAVRPIDRRETVVLTEAFDRIAARTIRTPRDVPAFARATWDGYAVRAGDVRRATPRRPVKLRVVGEVFAESRFAGRLGRGEAVAIATGAGLPPGADAVEIFEEVERSNSTVVLRASVRRGARIAPAGSDLRRGTVLARPGDRLTPATLGAIAASGVGSVSVYGRPVVTIVPNGNELRSPGGRARPGEIFESNNATLAAVARAAGCEPRPLPPIRDDASAIEEALRQALRTSEMVLATGGSSVGERDHLPRILPRIGRLLFHGVAVRPGKPTLAASAGGRLLVGLPGHPTSCLLNMHWLMLPVLRRLARRPGPGWTVHTLPLRGAAAAPSPGLSTIVPLRVRGRGVYPTFHGSSAIRSLHGADGFAILPPGRRVASPGTLLRVHLLDPPLGGAGRA
jgi:molybdenum cofactor synthesis domain-containing protein